MVLDWLRYFLMFFKDYAVNPCVAGSSPAGGEKKAVVSNTLFTTAFFIGIASLRR